MTTSVSFIVGNNVVARKLELKKFKQTEFKVEDSDSARPSHQSMPKSAIMPAYAADDCVSFGLGFEVV